MRHVGRRTVADHDDAALLVIGDRVVSSGTGAGTARLELPELNAHAFLPAGQRIVPDTDDMTKRDVGAAAAINQHADVRPNGRFVAANDEPRQFEVFCAVDVHDRVRRIAEGLGRDDLRPADRANLQVILAVADDHLLLVDAPGHQNAIAGFGGIDRLLNRVEIRVRKLLTIVVHPKGRRCCPVLERFQA